MNFIIGLAYNSFFTKDDNEDALFELEKEQGTNLQIYDSIRTEEGKTILKLKLRK